MQKRRKKNPLYSFCRKGGQKKDSGGSRKTGIVIGGGSVRWEESGEAKGRGEVVAKKILEVFSIRKLGREVCVEGMRSVSVPLEEAARQKAGFGCKRGGALTGRDGVVWLTEKSAVHCVRMTGPQLADTIGLGLRRHKGGREGGGWPVEN